MDQTIDNVDMTAREAATSIRGAWQTAFNAKDFEALVALYSPDATLYGSKPDLYRGRDGLLRYFRSVPRAAQSRFPDQELREIAPGIALTAGVFVFTIDGEDRTFRLTMVLTKSDSGWQISQHHASPKAAQDSLFLGSVPRQRKNL